MIHTAGWPLQNDVYGGSYLYHLDKNQVAVGYVVGLGYKNPYLSPFEEFQKYKTHPFIKKFFNKGKKSPMEQEQLLQEWAAIFTSINFSGRMPDWRQRRIFERIAYKR